jgi:RNA polymerase sigma-70 factor (ECF subfamily)
MGTLVAHTSANFQVDTRTVPFVCPEERAFVARLCAGDEAAYEGLIDRFERPVFNLVSRLTDDSADVPDVVQEVFLKVFRNIDSFRGGSSLKTWVYRIAVNESRNHRRWFGRHKKQEVTIEPRTDEAENHQEWFPDPGMSPLELAIDHERGALIEMALGEINPHFRAVLVLREIEGLNYDEIADILEISLGTVKSRILRGREALRQRLVEYLKQGEPAPAGWRARTVIAE